jgi:hypothetical protein
MLPCPGLACAIGFVTFIWGLMSEIALIGPRL